MFAVDVDAPVALAVGVAVAVVIAVTVRKWIAISITDVVIIIVNYVRRIWNTKPSRHTINSHANKKLQSAIPDLNIGVSHVGGSCQHLYLNKWEGRYVCTDCDYPLEETIDVDSVRIQLEQEKELGTPCDIVSPLMSVGKMSQMRGVSIEFLLAFTTKFNCWDKSSWWIIRHIIKPMTESRRCRFVELDWMAEHVGPAKTFISYAQQGSWGDLVAAILDGGADLKRTVWIDIFAVRQWPSDTPDLDFASTIEYCESFLCVCSYVESVDKIEERTVYGRKIDLIPAVDRKKIAFLRVWCLVEIAAAAKKIDMPIIMKCGSHKVNSDGSIEFESKSDLLKNLFFLIDINQAEATVESDKERILSGIQDHFTVEGLNGVIRGVLIGALVIAIFGDIGSIVQCAACGDRSALQFIMTDPTKSVFAVAAGGYKKILQMIIKTRVNVNAKDNVCWTALMHASAGGHVSSIDMLIARGADVNAKDNDGRTALMDASLGGHVSSIDMLIARGADVNAKNNNGGTALMAASVGGHVSSIDMLIARGADVNAKNNDGGTALMSASVAGHVSSIDILIARGADVNAKDNDGETALMYASAGGHVKSIDMLIARGADVNAKKNDGSIALMYASAGGHVSSIDMLIARGADVNAKKNDGWTALICASVGGHVSSIDMLIARGADVNAKDNECRTALMWASHLGLVSSIDMLIARGADVNAKNNNGGTALMAASHGGHVSSIDMLIATGADVNAKDNNGMTALMFVYQGGHTDAIETLKRHGAVSS